MLKLTLTPEERTALERLLRTGKSAHLREKAQALLLVANGHSATKVACQMLPRPRQPVSVQRWIHRYQQGGIDALRVQEGRGRKPRLFRCDTRCRPHQSRTERTSSSAIE